jgi:hypothetical protein
MKQIQPVTTWLNGSSEIATILSAKSIYDNLLDKATFSYGLYKEGENPEYPIILVGGNLDLEGQEYLDWGTSEDINEDAYEIIASKLGLTILPTTTSTSTTTTEEPIVEEPITEEPII